MIQKNNMKLISIVIVSFLALISGFCVADVVNTNQIIEESTTTLGSITPLHGKTLPLPSDRHIEVDLDQPAETRWSGIIVKYNKELDLIEDFLRKLLPGFLFPLAELAITAAEEAEVIPLEYLQEIKGLAKATNRKVGLFLILNLYYELNSGCTSIVSSTADGSIIHGRNLDYSVPGLADITADVTFVRGGNVVFRSTTYVGYTGIVTGLVPGGYSISMDQRRYSPKPIQGLIKNAIMALYFKGSLPVGMHIRKVLESKTTYNDALEALQIAEEISTSYLILGGISGDEGAVITRDRKGVADVRTLDLGAGIWYVLETNYDWWKGVPKADDRRTPVLRNMNALGRLNATLGTLESEVLSQFPTLNGKSTYTTVMSAATGERSTWLRNID